MTTPNTSHACFYYGVERGIYEAQAHFVDGVPFVGGRGQLLGDLLADVDRREGEALLTDLIAVASSMIERGNLGDARTLGARLVELGASMTSPIAAAVPASESGTWSADYGNGGRPITGETDAVPDAPVLEPVDGMTDDELDAIDRATAETDVADERAEATESGRGRRSR